METHVSSTTTDVPDIQEVIGSHGYVEIVVAVEKIEEDVQQKADSNSLDNAQPVMEESSPPCSQSTKTDGLHKSPCEQEPCEEEIIKTAPFPIKLQSAKQPNLITNTNETQTSQSKLSGKQVGVVTQNVPDKELPASADVDSTSRKDIPMDISSDEVDNKNDITLNITVDREPSNESQPDMTSDAEKEHNKSISRELKSLINSAKESKIISECTKLTSKTRKSARVALDTSSTNINNTPEADYIRGNRRSSSNSQKSNSSEKSNRVAKRSMRSQNPEFVHKVRKFLNSVTGKFQKDAISDESTVSDEETVAPKIKENTTDSSPSNAKDQNPNQEQVQSQSKIDEKSNKLRSDPYCWRCHWSIHKDDGEKTRQPPLMCTVCPRTFDYKCLTGSEKNKTSSAKNWVCPECMTVLHAESSETRSHAMKKTSLGMLCELLKYALQRMTEVTGSEPFLQSVDRSVFPDYDKYVVHPMDLALMREHIEEGLYGSTEAFLLDAHWILHNSIIFNTFQSKLTTTARALVRSCRTEMAEIEACPECYAAAHARRPTWFTDVCSTPHLLLWAKLKGFPYWPAKAMSVSHAGMVDVRFFGAHDRAWVSARDCYLYCERDPNNFRNKRQDMVDAMQEAEQHIRNISRKYGKFAYAPYRTTFEASKLEQALKYMIPSFDGQVRSPVRERRSKTPARGLKSRSNSKGSKDDSNAGDTVSDSEQMGTETPKTEDAEKNKEKEGNVPAEKARATTRKRTRSETKGPAESSPKEKRRLLDTPGKETEPNKTDPPVVTSSKEIGHKQSKSEDAASGEPAAAAPLPPAAHKADATPKPNKNPKTKNVVAPNKTPAKTDVPKTNVKEKNAQQGEKPVPSNERISRSIKPSNNIETIELDANNPTISSNETSAPSVTNIAKTNPSKVAPKDAVPITKVNEKEKTTESAVLIKINDESNKDASLTITVNAKDKLTEAATLTKITDIVKMTHNKIKIQDKDTENTTPYKDGGKEKVATVTSNKNATKTTPSTKNLDSEKTNNGGPTVSNTTTDKTVSDSSVSSDTRKVNKKEGTDEIADKTPDTNTESKKIVVDKEKSASAKNDFSQAKAFFKANPIKYDHDTSLAAIAGKVPKNNSKSDVSAGVAGSGGTSTAASPLADAPPASPATRSSSASKASAITVQVNPDSSIFTPTSTDKVRNMKEAVNKLQKLRSGFDPPANPQVGKVGVRSFAKLSSPLEKQAKLNDVLVEIKSEPMEYEDCDAPQETSTVLDSLRPRPIAPAVSAPNLREVRISKVTPVASPTKKSPKPPDVRPRAKKTFPQPKKADDGRSELTNKNSMVYIPIQPPIAQSPVRAALKAVNSAAATPLRTPTLFSAANMKGVTSMAPPLLPMAPPPQPVTTATATSAVAGAILAPGFPAVPTTVHTVPLITSVNGQWTFSLQPVMSVGAGESITSATVNGVSERAPVAAPPPLSPTPPPAAPAPPTASPALSATQPPALVPTGAPAAPVNPPVPDATRSPATELPPPPQLQQRPALQHPLAAGTEIGEMTAPSSAGPLTAKLNHNSIKLAEFFRHLLEESLVQVVDPTAETVALRLQLEQERWRYQHELAELRRTNEVAQVEIRAAMDKEKTRAVAEARRLAHQELEAAVKNAKSKQWCANCGQEAQFYCCWNTSYCDYPCQRAHWGQHYAHCTQHRTNASSLPTVTAKVTSATTRTLNSEQMHNKSPVAVSVADEGNGHAAAKSAGASPQAASPTHAAPLLANEQLMNNDENAPKRVVTSGGYLIVGAGAAGDTRRAPRRD